MKIKNKNQPFAEKFLRVLAVVNMVSLFFPIIMLSEVDSYDNVSPLRILGYYAIFAAAFGIGMAFDHLSDRDIGNYAEVERFSARLKSFFTNMIMVLLGMLIFVLPLVILIVTKRFHSYILMLCFGCLFHYAIGMWSHKKPYEQIVKPIGIGVLFATSIITFVLFGFEYEDYLSRPTAQRLIEICLLANLLIVAVISNQASITAMTERRPDTENLIPRKLRQRGALLTLVVCLGIISVFLFRHQIAWVMSFVASVILLVVLKIMSLLPFLDTAELEAMRQGPSQLATGGGQNVVATVVNFILFAVLIYVIFRNRERIWNALTNLISRLIELLTSTKKTEETQAKEDAYIDYIERIDKKAVRTKVKLRSLLKQYKKEPDREKKLRLSFRIFALWLSEKTGDVTPHDTASEIVGKGSRYYLNKAEQENHETLAAMQEYLNRYQDVRYGEQLAADEGLVLADKLVGEIKRHL